MAISLRVLRRTRSVAVALVLVGVLMPRASFADDAPQLAVMAGEQSIPVTVGTICWPFKGEVMCADKMQPFVVLKGAVAPVVPAGTVLELRFSLKPSHVQVVQYVGGAPSPVRNPSRIVVKDPGRYIYEVNADWEQGDAIYGFTVEMKKASESPKPESPSKQESQSKKESPSPTEPPNREESPFQ